MLSGEPEEFRKGVGRFFKDSSFDELRRINHIRGQTGKTKRSMVAVSKRREAIIRGYGGVGCRPVDPARGCLPFPNEGGG